MLRNFIKYKLLCINVRDMNKFCKNIMIDVCKGKKWIFFVIFIYIRKNRSFLLFLGIFKF